MKNANKPTNMVQKQTLYIAVLVAATFGFMAGAAYTSFTLAGGGGNGVAAVGMPNAAPEAPENASEKRNDVETGARILELEAFLKENPDNAEGWTRLGNLFFDTDRFKDAIDAYERSVELAPGDPAVLTDLGVMYRRNKEPEKAVQCFDKAVTARPDFETAHFNKGIVLLHDLKDTEGALKAWEALVEINPMAEAPNGQLVNNLVQGLRQSKK